MTQKVVDLGPAKLMLVLSLRGIGVKHCEMDLETSKSVHLGWGCGREGLGGRWSLICWGSFSLLPVGWGFFSVGCQETVVGYRKLPKEAFLEGLICPLGVVWIEGGED